MKIDRHSKRVARRLFRVCVTQELLSEARARQVAARLAAARGGRWLPVLSEFVRLVRLDCERRTAVVESAVPLPADVCDDIGTRVAGAYGPGLTTRFALNPSLLAGLRIRVGSYILDGSVRARLAALEARL
jgi:F-type H+-transporting ATPase subunit delta